MPRSSIVHSSGGGAISDISIPTGSSQIVMGWIRRTTVGTVASNNQHILGFGSGPSRTSETVGNWGFGIGSGSNGHFARVQSTYYDFRTTIISSSTDWNFVVVQRASGSTLIGLRMFMDDGPTFTKHVDNSVFGDSAGRNKDRLIINALDTSFQFTGIRVFTGSTFTDDQCREQAAYRFPPTHPTSSLYEYWILDTNTQLTGSVNGIILSGPTGSVSASSAPVSLLSAQRLRYVNTNSTAGGTGLTNDTASADRAYVSLWDASQGQIGANNTLITNDQYLEIQCGGTLSDNNATTRYPGQNITTDEEHYMLITAVPGQEAPAIFDRTKYVYSGSMAMATPFMRIQRIQFDGSGSINNAALGTTAGVFSGSYHIHGCHFTSSGAIYAAMAVSPDGSGSRTFITNNIIEITGSYGMLIQSTAGYGTTHSLHNNTVVGRVTRGYFVTYYGVNDVINFKNNLASGSTNVDFYTEATATEANIENNASADNSAYANSVGGGTLRNRTFRFRNPSLGDYRLHGGDTGAKRLGANLSADAYYPFTNDFSGQNRNLDVGWDIGFDQSDRGYAAISVSGTQGLGQLTASGSGKLVTGRDN